MTEKNVINYPSCQPFFQNLVVSLEGKNRTESLNVKQLHTFESKPFKKANSKLNYYLTHYSSDESSAGITLGIKGSYGSGKTHLLDYLMQTAWKSNADIQQIYVKAESNDFLTLYHRIIKQVKRQKIQQIKTIWLSKIAQSEANKHEITKPIVDILKQNPNAVYKYFNNGLISQSEVEHIQLECVREITHDDNFLQAISYLTDSELERDVYDWLLGRSLSLTTLSSLGIRNAIDNVELAKVSLHFLVTLFARANQPLLLYIDKIEDLLLDTSAEVRSANIGALYSLAEIFSRENCFLCLSGVTDAWNGLSEDFFARVHCVDISNLSLDESLNLMKTYLSSSDEFSPYTNEEDIYPYTEASVREMVRLSHGNIRQILHLAYETFEEAAPNQAPIEVETVKKAALSFNKYFDRQTILKEIADILRKARIPFVENQKLLDYLHLEIAAPDVKDPTVLIEVSEPVFSEDEIQKTINFASHAQIFHRIFPKAKLIMVVAGYLSPELHKKLSEVVDHCLIYTPDKFKNDFSKILDSFIVTTEFRSASYTEIEKLSEGIQTLLTQFKPLLENRLYDSQKLEQQFSDYIQRLQNLEETRISEGIQNLLTQLKPLLENRLYDSRKLEQQFSDYIQRLQNLEERRIRQWKHEREESPEYEDEGLKYLIGVVREFEELSYAFQGLLYAFEKENLRSVRSVLTRLARKFKELPYVFERENPRFANSLRRLAREFEELPYVFEIENTRSVLRWLVRGFEDIPYIFERYNPRFAEPSRRLERVIKELYEFERNKKLWYKFRLRTMWPKPRYVYGILAFVAIAISVVSIPGLVPLTNTFLLSPWLWISLATLGTVFFSFLYRDEYSLPRFIFVGGMTIVAIAISIVLIPELLSSITQSTITVFSSPWLWIFLAMVGTILFNYGAFNDDNQLVRYLGITLAVILLFVILFLLFTSSALISSINQFFVSVVKVLISPLTLGIIGVLLSSLWLFWGALNTLKRREFQKQTIMNIEKYKQDETFSFMSSKQEDKLIKSSRSNDLVINPLKYATPFFVSIGITYAFNIFATNITIFLAVLGCLLSPLLFLRIPVYKTDKK